jgi:prepilin-type N-terminal cleavage/methylation domain-containing protein
LVVPVDDEPVLAEAEVNPPPAQGARPGPHSASGSRRRAFTLTELLAVIGLVGTLVALLLPAAS